jgi:hypothetical protein
MEYAIRRTFLRKSPPLVDAPRLFKEFEYTNAIAGNTHPDTMAQDIPTINNRFFLAPLPNENTSAIDAKGASGCFSFSTFALGWFITETILVRSFRMMVGSLV